MGSSFDQYTFGKNCGRVLQQNFSATEARRQLDMALDRGPLRGAVRLQRR
jgi:hypothetical protein